MNASHFLLSVISACGGRVCGRTLLQKKSYFIGLLTRVPVHLGYQAHYYGPYSPVVDGTLTQMKNLGFVEEASTGFGIVSGGFEVRRYDYSLTEDGKKVLKPVLEGSEYKAIQEAVNKIREAGEPDYVELSIAAKAFYILSGRQKGMSSAELLREAKRFNWNISEKSLRRAVDFLKRVGLAKG
jgi:uncharacterized protein YwgA